MVTRRSSWYAPVAVALLLPLLGVSLASAATPQAAPGSAVGASQPACTVTIPASGTVTGCNATFTGTPGTVITVGPNGAINIQSPTSTSPTVTPGRGFVLAIYNPATGQFTLVPGTVLSNGTVVFLLPSTAVTVSGRRVVIGPAGPVAVKGNLLLPQVAGGRVAPCALPARKNGFPAKGCEVVTVNTIPFATVRVSVLYPHHSTQNFTGTANGSGRYVRAFPILYSAQQLCGCSKIKVGVRIGVTRSNGLGGGGATAVFIDR